MADYTYTIGGEEFIAFNNRLYKVREEVNSLDEIDTEELYLTVYQNNNDKTTRVVGKFRKDDYSAFDAVFTSNKDTDFKHYYMVEPQGNLGREFDHAFRLESVIPDEIEECPECGSWAGEKDDEDTPECYRCGYGIGGSEESVEAE